MTRTIEVSEETYDKIKDQLREGEQEDIGSYDDMIGKKYFFRTVTYHLVGRVRKRVTSKFLLLEDASWIADSGRFMNFIKEGKVNEVEPVGMVYVNLDTVTDFFPWKHTLPKVQK
jgi:hypothetical protein